MWTGFRLHTGGAQEYYGVDADLACFSKAMANGMPISALTGRKDIMKLLEKDVFFFTTFGGEALSLASAKATINEIKEKDVTSFLSYQGKKLKDGYNKIAEKLEMNYTKCKGLNARSIITFDASAGNPMEIKTLMQQELFKRGILWAGFHNMSYSHTDEDIQHTLDSYEEVLQIVADAVDDNNVTSLIRGEILEPVFRKTGNFNTKPKRGVAA
jgi:glutamate-1-semialdehyde 2,1-aminomutase